MIKFNTSHLLTGEELNLDELLDLLDCAEKLNHERHQGMIRTDLVGKTLTLLFEKPSLRTRVSFTVAMRELGGDIVECLASSRKHEEPEDVVQVLGGYTHAIMLRTHEHSNLIRMANKSSIPVINGLSDSHHPCQIFADLLTLKQHFEKLEGLTVTYVGDGNNILHSLMLLMPILGIHLRYSCPNNYMPDPLIVKNAIDRIKLIKVKGSISSFSDPRSAVQGAIAVYTDVWTSMGFEEEQTDREEAFKNYQVNEELLSHAQQGALVMHCMPMIKGKEISATLAEHPKAVFFKQSENRLHVQKALLLALLKH